MDVVWALIGIGVGIFLRSYFGEKGKNLATKEDIKGITEVVERTKAEYAKDVEQARAGFGRGNQVFAEQYRREVDVYREVWEHLIEVQNAANALRPMLDTGLAPKETAESRKQERLAAFGEAFNNFTAVVWRRRPFYPEAVHMELRKLADIVYGEAIDYRFGDPIMDNKYWRQADVNAKRTGAQIDNICEVIRVRIGEVSAP